MAHKALLIAGEASGDLYGGLLLKELARLVPSYSFCALGGKEIAAAGAELREDLVSQAVIGFSEVLARLPTYWKIWRRLSKFLETERPDPVILIDYPGFNLRVAKKAHSLGLTTIYYIAPKVWIWKASRAKTLARAADLVVTIFPFEPPLYTCHGGRAVYCGHPLVDVIARQGYRPSDGKSDAIAVLPGSRPQEITRLLPRFTAAAQIIAARYPDIRFIIPRARTVDRQLIARLLDEPTAGGLNIEVVEECAAKVLCGSKAALAASGTVTLEAALLGVPMVIAYAVSAFSGIVYNLIVHAEHAGLPNIVAGRRICPELLQGEATPQAMADALLPLLEDGRERRKQLEELTRVRTLLGEAGSIKRAAAAMAACFKKDGR